MVAIVSPSQLDLFSAFFDQPIVSESLIDDSVKVVSKKSAEENSDLDYFVPFRKFSVEDVEALHKGMMHEVLSILAREYKTGSRRKDFSIAAQALCEAIEWVYRPDIFDGVRSSDIPLTFQACCVVHGIRTDAMQEAIFGRFEVCRNMDLLVKNGYADFLTIYSRDEVLRAAAAFPVMQRVADRYNPYYMEYIWSLDSDN